MKYLKFLFSPVLMGFLFVAFALSMAVATFVENDFGSPVAYSMVYNTLWFELILLLLATNLVGQLIMFKLFRRTKLTTALFHLSFLLLILGAAITRYFGWEGTMHIREGEEQTECYSAEKYIICSVKEADGSVTYIRSDKYSLTSVSADEYKKVIKINGNDYNMVLSRIIPNANEVLKSNPGGVPVVSMVVTSGMMEKEALFLNKGERKIAAGVSIGFESADSADVNISFDGKAFYISSGFELGEMSMMTQAVTLAEPGKPVRLKEMQILSVRGVKIVPQEMLVNGVQTVVAVNPKEQTTGQNAFIFHLSGEKGSSDLTLWDRESEKLGTVTGVMDGKTVEISYGSKITNLPFSIRLNDFILERYPGSSSPSGYKSDVVLVDKSANVEKPFMIFMNNILKYKGYRFYQSSFDRDEQGTILSVNHDMAGMLVSYTGYIFLFIFVILSLINKNTLFHNITAGYWNSTLRKATTAIVLMLFLSGVTVVNAQKLIPDKSVAQEFGKVLVQDQKGRTKPLFTLSNDILRKVTRENEFEGLTSMQVFLGLYLDFDNWKDVPMIRISAQDIQKKLGINGKFAAFTDIVNLEGNGDYKLSVDVNKAYAKAPGDRNKSDKEVMKIDERMNIVYMIYKGEFLKLFPLKNGTHDWGLPEAALPKAINKDDSLYLKTILPLLDDAIKANNISTTRQISESISGYQKRFSEYDLPSISKTNAELLYYRLGIFEKLFPFYATVGLVMLIGLIIMVIRSTKRTSLLVKLLGWLLFAGFLVHTFGLGLRWYIAGHAPLSNGYESMIFISWVTLLAGFIFSRKSAFSLSATAVLASMTLMVAHLSFMDPEITNLVPVLKSYWLTLHVSVITGSYGFLGLGAILGLIIMVLLLFTNSGNRERISATIDELTVINYKSLTLGLYFLTIGTFLGAVWANESWGRYWGWDPKETWSLITIIIYSIVIHSRNIPGMKDIFTFNLLSLFAFSSVLMTYFGVNYYLSGMHSYAAGDPVPVPSFVYVTVILLAALSLIAYLKYNSFKGARDMETPKKGE
jgi:cytochrome c-type biogenesis protein CcsB